jgi:hypothetical protein
MSDAGRSNGHDSLYQRMLRPRDVRTSKRKLSAEARVDGVLAHAHHASAGPPRREQADDHTQQECGQRAREALLQDPEDEAAAF